jgi:hypothetical protein
MMMDGGWTMDLVDLLLDYSLLFIIIKVEKG